MKNQFSFFISILIHLIPIYGVFWLGWRITDIMILYWWESGLIAGFSLFGLYLLLRKNKDKKEGFRKERKLSNFYFISFLLLTIVFGYATWKVGISNLGIDKVLIYVLALLLLREVVEFKRMFVGHEARPLDISSRIGRYMAPNAMAMIIFASLYIEIFFITGDIFNDQFLYFVLFMLVGVQIFMEFVRRRDKSYTTYVA